MRGSRQRRRGVSLIEILIVIGILAVLIGLLLTAIQSARKSVALTKNKNNLRQIILATHQLASLNEGKIDNLTRGSMRDEPVNIEASLFLRLTPYVSAPRLMPTDLSTQAHLDYISPNVAIYRNPSDPSWDYVPVHVNTRGKCSYALNMYAIDGSVNLAASIPDGTSETIAFVDKYAIRGSSDPNSTIAQTLNIYTAVFDPIQGEFYGYRRASFADRGWGDVLPVTEPATAITRPSVAGLTFQVNPRPEDVDPRIPQTPHMAGLTVALFDGSVRTISSSVTETTFWALVTPAGGEAVNLD